jgi:hypothetical protein
MIKNRLLILTGLVLTLSLSAPKNVFCATGAGAGSGASAMPLYTSTVGAGSGARAMPLYTSTVGASSGAGAGAPLTPTYENIIKRLKHQKNNLPEFTRACNDFLALLNESKIPVTLEERLKLNKLRIPINQPDPLKQDLVISNLYFLNSAKQRALNAIAKNNVAAETLMVINELKRVKSGLSPDDEVGSRAKMLQHTIDQLNSNGKMEITPDMIGLDRLHRQTGTITTSQQRAAGLSLQAIPEAEEEGKEDESPETAVETRAMAGHDRLTAEEQLAIAASEIDANIAQLSPLGLTIEDFLSNIVDEINKALKTLASTTDLAKTVEDIAHRVLLITVLKQRGVMLKEASRENLRQELQKLSAYNENPDKATPQTLALESNLRTALEETAASTSHGAGAGAGLTVGSSEDAIAPKLDRYQQKFKDEAIAAATKSYNENNGQIWIKFIQSRGGTEAVKALWLRTSPTKNIYQTLIALKIATADDMIAKEGFYDAFAFTHSLN